LFRTFVACTDSNHLSTNLLVFSLFLLVGNFIPISQVREDVALAYRKEAEWQASNTLLPYKTMCTQRKVGLRNHPITSPATFPNFVVVCSCIAHESHRSFHVEQVEAEAVLLESDDVAAAISEEIAKYNICKLVLGSSSGNIFRR
jgi:hypothetical protein